MTTTHTVPGLRVDTLVQQMAHATAGELRRGARRLNIFEQRLVVLGLLHDDPALLVEAVMHLARAAPDYTAADAVQALDGYEEVDVHAVVQGRRPAP